MSDATPSRKYGRRAPASHPTTPWFIATATASPTPRSLSSSSQGQDQLDAPEALDTDADPFTIETTTARKRRPPRRGASQSTDLDDTVSPTTTPKAHTLVPPDTPLPASKPPVPTPKAAVRRSRSDPFAFDNAGAPADPPPKRAKKAVVIPESLIAPALPPLPQKHMSPLLPETTVSPSAEASKGPSPPTGERSPSGPKSALPPRQPSPQLVPVVAKPALPASLQLEPICNVTDAFAFDLPPLAPPPGQSSLTASSSKAPTPSRPPLSPPATRLVIPRSESQVLGNFFDSDEDDDSESQPPRTSAPELMRNGKQVLKRKASMDAISTPPNKKIATGSVGRSGVFDADSLGSSSDSQGSNGGAVEIRTLHEMREAGENRRIAEEAEFLAQGLDAAQPLTLRQYSALDLLRKLSKPAQRRKLASNNSLPLLLDALSQHSDSIIMLCFLLTVHAILSDPEIHHVAIQSLALDRHLFQPHVTAALASPPPTLPNDSKQARGMLSDLRSLANAVSVSHDMLAIHPLWTANVHKLVHMAPAAIAGLMDSTLVGLVVKATLAESLQDRADGFKVTEWIDGRRMEQAVGLLEQLSFVSTTVAEALRQDRGADLRIVLLLGWFVVRAHAILVAKVTGEDVDAVECTLGELQVDEVDAASALLTTLRLLINVTHAEPKLLESLVTVHDGDAELLPALVQVTLSMLTGPLGQDPIWMLVHRKMTAGSGGAINSSAGGPGAGGGYSQSSQSQAGAIADLDPIASLSDRTNPRLVAVGFLLNLAEGAPEAVGNALAKEMRVEALVPVIDGATDKPESAQGMTTGVISAFAAVVLATALVQMEATARERVRTRFACATWSTLRRALERFTEYQRAGIDDGEEVEGEPTCQGRDVIGANGKDKDQTSGHRLLRHVSEWL